MEPIPSFIKLPSWLVANGTPEAEEIRLLDLKFDLLRKWRNAHHGPLWDAITDPRTCLRCRRSFTGRDVLVEQGRFSKPPEYDLLCPTPGCHSSPAEWTSQSEEISIARRSVGDEGRGLFTREFWLRPRYRCLQQEDEMRLLLWDQRARREDPLWARPNPRFTREIVSRCNREVGFVIYTNGPEEGEWHPKDPARPESLRQEPMSLYHPVTRIESVGAYWRRRLPEFFIITVEFKMIPKVAAKALAAPPGSVKLFTKMQGREAGAAARLGIEEGLAAHFTTNGKKIDLTGFCWTVREKTLAGWQPLGTPPD